MHAHPLRHALPAQLTLFESRPVLAAVLQAMLGLRITWRNEARIPQERHVMVSNHITAGDLMVLYSRPERYVHLVTASIPNAATQVRTAAVSRTSTASISESNAWVLLSYCAHVDQMGGIRQSCRASLTPPCWCFSVVLRISDLI